MITAPSSERCSAPDMRIRNQSRSTGASSRRTTAYRGVSTPRSRARWCTRSSFSRSRRSFIGSSADHRAGWCPSSRCTGSQKPGRPANARRRTRGPRLTSAARPRSGRGRGARRTRDEPPPHRRSAARRARDVLAGVDQSRAARRHPAVTLARGRQPAAALAQPRRQARLVGEQQHLDALFLERREHLVQSGRGGPARSQRVLQARLSAHAHGHARRLRRRAPPLCTISVRSGACSRSCSTTPARRSCRSRCRLASTTGHSSSEATIATCSNGRRRCARSSSSAA